MARVVVVGAGVIGLCCAYALRRRGLEVVVLDGGSPGGGASLGNGGWICPSLSGPIPAPGLIATSLRWLARPDSPFSIRPRLDPRFLRWLWAFRGRCNARDYRRGLEAVAGLNERTMELFDAMAADGVAFEMHRQGLLFLFRTPAAARAERRDLLRLERHGQAPARWLDPAALRAEEPGVSDAVIGGLLGYFTLARGMEWIPYVLVFASSGFIYIALSDLMPQMQRRATMGETIPQVLLIAVGVVIVLFLTRHG